MGEEVEFGEAEEAVGEDYGVFWGVVGGAGDGVGGFEERGEGLGVRVMRGTVGCAEEGTGGVKASLMSWCLEGGWMGDGCCDAEAAPVVGPGDADWRH